MGLFHNLFGRDKEAEETKKAIVLDTYSPVEKLISKKEMKFLSSLYVSGPARANKGVEILKFIKQICLKYNKLQDIDLSGIIGLDEIPEEALSECKSLVHITLPNGIRTIKNNAFEKCTNLENISFPEGLERIYEMAFYNCTKLSNINLPKSLYRLGKEVFAGNDSLTSITIPSRVESIGTGALSCKNLKQITVEPHNPSYIAKENVLYSRNGSALVQYACGCEDVKFIVPDTVAKIVEEAFAGCEHITQIEMSDEVNIIGKGAFRNCVMLKNLSFSPRVENIGDEAFMGCSGLETISFNKGITNIGARSFYNCTSIRELSLPNSIVKIGDEAFANCSALEECSIPSSAEYIGKNVFSGSKVRNKE